jgi:predicted metal-dependent phosphotriesterase family hydrolase
MAHVMSVRGPIPPEAIGFTLMHEHIFIDLTAFPAGTQRVGLDAVFDPARHMQLMIEEVAAFQRFEGKSIVDPTVRNLGGNVAAVRRFSETTGLNIVMGCGWYRDSYMEQDLYYRSTEEIAEELLNDIEHGFGTTGIRPGIIGEIGTNLLHLTAKEERCLRAAAKAQRRSGLAITTHLPQAGVAIEVLDILQEHGVPPDRVIIGHSDIYLDVAYHAALAKRGAYVQYDNLGCTYDQPRQGPAVVAHVAEMIRQGYVERILLAHDICWRQHLAAFNGKGFDYLPRRFLPELRANGVSEESIRTMTVLNPRRVLSV